MRLKTAGRILLQLAVSAAFVGLLLWRGDLGDFLTALRDADWWWIAGAAAMVVGSRMAHGIRWWLQLRRIGRVPLRGVVLVMLAATGVSVILPLRAGTVLQVQVIRSRYDIDRAAVGGTLLLEPFLDLTAMVVIAAVAIPLFGLQEFVPWQSVVIAAAIIAVALAVLAATVWSDGWKAALRLAPARVRGWMTAQVGNLGRGLKTAGSAGYVTLLLSVTFVDWAFAFASYWLTGRAFSLVAPAKAYLAVAITANLSSAVPLTQANVGPYELIVRGTLGAFGVPGDRATAFAVASHAAIIIPTALTGVAAVWALRLRWHDVFYLRAADSGEDTADDQAKAVPNPAVHPRSG